MRKKPRRPLTSTLGLMSRFEALSPDERSVIKALIAAFANSGHIDLSKSDDEVWSQFRAVAAQLPDDFDVVLDHTPALLRHARTARAKNDYELAVLMYATWVEHSINLVMQHFAIARGLSRNDFQGMLREASLRAKTTWLLPLLGVKPLNPQTVARIQKLADARNAFIHYKWGQLSEDAKAHQERALADAEKVVRAIQRLKREEAKILSERSQAVKALLHT